MSYLPLKLSAIYLIVGILYFFLGAVNYRIDNFYSFIFYIGCYFGAGGIGYFSGIYLAQRLKINKRRKLIRNNFWIFSMVALISALVFNASLAKEASLIPYNLFNLIQKLISFNLPTLGEIYYETRSDAGGSSGNIFLSILLFLFGWARFLYVPYTIWHWNKFSKVRKLVSTILISIPIFSGLSVGTNKPIFDVALLFFFSILSIYYIKKYHREIEQTRKLRKSLKFAGILLVISVTIFGSAMNSRGVSFKYIENNSPKGDITVKQNLPENQYSISLVMLGHYLVQGYYGFSLSLHESFDSTLGFGHSPFLMRQYERVLGTDLSKLTYQSKIDNEWAQGVRWHSAFSQFANDVHFVGVILVVFVIFFLLSFSWLLAFKYQVAEMIYVIPIYGILIIFLPANNQILGFVDSFSAVVIISLSLLARVLNIK